MFLQGGFGGGKLFLNEEQAAADEPCVSKIRMLAHKAIDERESFVNVSRGQEDVDAISKVAWTPAKGGDFRFERVGDAQVGGSGGGFA
jgi:hypothetical protein